MCAQVHACARVCMCLCLSLCFMVLESLHSDNTSGHLGVTHSLERVNLRLFWVENAGRYCNLVGKFSEVPT